MANRFDLTARLQLVGPANLRQVASKLHRDLSKIQANINVGVNPAATRQVRQLNKETAALGGSLTGVQGSSNGASKALNTVSQSANRAKRSMAQSAAGMQAFGQQAALAAKRFLAFSLPIGFIYGVGRAITSAVRAGIDWQHNLIRISQVGGQSAGQLRSLTADIGGLSTSLGVSSRELQDASQTLIQAGFSANDTRIALGALAKSDLAPTFDNIKDTTEGVIAIMGQFQTPAKAIESQLGAINAVSAKYAVESADLITAVRKSGGAFSVAGGSLNELLASFTSIRHATRESADTIAVAIKTITARLQDPKRLSKLEDLLGIKLTDEGKTLGIFKTIGILSDALSKFDKQDLRTTGALREIAGIRQYGKIIPLIFNRALALEALEVAQRGQTSLDREAIKAQDSMLISLLSPR